MVYLLQNRDRVVSKDDLIALVWQGRIVSDSTLTSRIDAGANRHRRQRQGSETDPDNSAQGRRPEQEYFSDGISEDIIIARSKLRWFFVTARNSSFIYKDKAVHLKQIAEELGVRYVVEGSVRKDGDLVRITATAQRRDDGKPHLGGPL